jgi:hypothetical protein
LREIQLTSGGREISLLIPSVSDAPSIGAGSLDDAFLSEASGIEDIAPKAGDAIRELALEGSRFAVNAAFRRFSASSASFFSCS